MLDLVFLAVAIFVIVKANKGEYNETACNIALVVGVLAGLVGCIYGITTKQGFFVFLNVIVMVGAFGIRFAAKLFAKLYIDKMVAETERLEYEAHKRDRFPNQTAYTDDTFDDEELRFGKGGYTENDLVSFDKIEVGDDVEPLFGNSGSGGRKKVSLEKKKVSLEKKDISTDKNFSGTGGFTDNRL